LPGESVWNGFAYANSDSHSDGDHDGHSHGNRDGHSNCNGVRHTDSQSNSHDNGDTNIDALRRTMYSDAAASSDSSTSALKALELKRSFLRELAKQFVSSRKAPSCLSRSASGQR
jgi:hypothetical protein